MSYLVDSDDKTNVLLEKITRCVTDRTVACEDRLDNIDLRIENYNKILHLINERSVEQKHEIGDVVRSIRIVQDNIITLAQQLKQTTDLLLVIANMRR